MSFFGFHPLIENWFRSRFASPSEPQQQGWPEIAAGRHTLIAAPTGSGKTLTAFLACIDRLLKRSLAGELSDGISIVYISPLRALSNDMHKNLEQPLAEISALVEDWLEEQSGASAAATSQSAVFQGGVRSENGELFAKDESLLPEVDTPIHATSCQAPPCSAAYVPIRVGLRTGDTSASERAKLVRKPPHILVTTPESLYLMLTSERGRAALATTETVIVDEIHALVRDKRGSHLVLSLERLEALCERRLQRIGLSATQRPLDRVANFLAGVGSDSDEAGQRSDPVSIIDVGHTRELDLQIEVPPSPLGAVCMHEQWAEVIEQLVELIHAHRSTLIFVGTRRMSERVTHLLTERLGEELVGAHHGSLAAELRLRTEQRLKSGELKAVVATASLELGIDIGYIDLVVQLGSPRSIAGFLQRIGRSGHSLGLVPRGRLFALTRDELLECMAVIRGVRGGRLDRVKIPVAPLDILAQQIVAEVASREWKTDELFELVRRAAPYQNLSRKNFDRVVEYLSEGLSTSSGRGRVYLHHDQVHGRLRARKGARIVAVGNAGAIPDNGTYRVVTSDTGTPVGTVDEEFAVESSRGDVFLLGNTSWRIEAVRGGDVTVSDAQGAPPTIPFWQGEAPGRSRELSDEVSQLREEIEARLDDPPALENWLIHETSCSPWAAQQIIEYTSAQKAAIGVLPTQKRIVFERFFDDTGGMQLVVHAPFGMAITRGWGFAMRKRFCRSFDFELQATADDDGFILSLGPQHSFPIESLFGMLTSQNVHNMLEQALLAAPVFQIRWRWNVTRSLLVMRMQNGKKVPPPFQRFRADDLLTSVFPRLTGCQEEHTGDIDLPDHPLVAQTMADCFTEYVDLEALTGVLAEIERGEMEFLARDTREPSPFAYELLNSNPYTFLDGGEVQERRARTAETRRSLTVESVRDLAWLDPAAISLVVAAARPLVRSVDELHDLLLGRIVVPEEEVDELLACELVQEGRATWIGLSEGRRGLVPAERLPAALAVFPTTVCTPEISVPPSVRREWTSVEARGTMLRGLMEICGPITPEAISSLLSIDLDNVNAGLEALEGEGSVLRGRFTPPEMRGEVSNSKTSESAARPPDAPLEWCHRRLLARIHRQTLEGLRRQIEPVSPTTYVQFLTHHHGVAGEARRSGTNGLFEVVQMLEGWDIPAIAWERDILASRLQGYRPEWLDELCLTGELAWGRLFPSKQSGERAKSMTGITRVAPVSLFLREDVGWLTRAVSPNFVEPEQLGGNATEVAEWLQRRGAMFASDLLAETRMLPTHLEDALGELVARGLVRSDTFAGLRKLIEESSNSSGLDSRRSLGMRRRTTAAGTGRWSLWRRGESETGSLEIGLGTFAVSDTSANSHTAANSSRATATSQTATTNEIEQWAWLLLRRWGVVFRDVVMREHGAPRWFDLLQQFRRMEARGEVRGGRFISGVAGEQFALGDAVRRLRELRDKGARNELVVLNAADPLNLSGVLSNDPRVPAIAAHHVALLDGVLVAARQAEGIVWFREVSALVRAVVIEMLRVGQTEFVRTIEIPKLSPTKSGGNSLNQEASQDQATTPMTTGTTAESEAGVRSASADRKANRREGSPPRSRDRRPPRSSQSIPRPRIW